MPWFILASSSSQARAAASTPICYFCSASTPGNGTSSQPSLPRRGICHIISLLECLGMPPTLNQGTPTGAGNNWVWNKFPAGLCAGPGFGVLLLCGSISAAGQGSSSGQGNNGTRGSPSGLANWLADLLARLTGAAAQAPEDSSGIDLWGNPRTLEDHFLRHGADFGATSAEDYANQASQFFERGLQDQLPTKIDPKTGVIRIYDPSSDTFGAYNANGTTRTFYKLDPAAYGYQTNWDYWQAQPGYSPWGS